MAEAAVTLKIGVTGMEILSRAGSEFQAAGKKAGAFKRAVGGIGGAWGRVVGIVKAHPIGAAIGGAASVAGITAMIKSTAKLGDRIAKLSKSTGVGVEALSAYKLSADLAGTSLESFAQSQQKLSRNMLDASQGTGEALKAFDQLGISVTDSEGKLKSSEEVFLEVADKFKDMKDGAQKTGLAMQIFGRSGAELIPMLNEGSESLRKQKEEAKKLGAVWTAEGAKKAELFNDSLARLKAGFMGLIMQGFLRIAPHLTSFVDWLTATITQGPRFNAFLTGAGAVLAAMSPPISFVLKGLGGIFDAFIAIGGVVVSIGKTIGSVFLDITRSIGEAYLKILSLAKSAVQYVPVVGSSLASGIGRAEKNIRQGISDLDARRFSGSTKAGSAVEVVASKTGSGAKALPVHEGLASGVVQSIVGETTLTGKILELRKQITEEMKKERPETDKISKAVKSILDLEKERKQIYKDIRRIESEVGLSATDRLGKLVDAVQGVKEQTFLATDLLGRTMQVNKRAATVSQFGGLRLAKGLTLEQAMRDESGVSGFERFKIGMLERTLRQQDLPGSFRAETAEKLFESRLSAFGKATTAGESAFQFQGAVEAMALAQQESLSVAREEINDRKRMLDMGAEQVRVALETNRILGDIDRKISDRNPGSYVIVGG